MDNRYIIVDTVIHTDDSLNGYFFTRYYSENFEYSRNGIPHIASSKLRITYDSHNGSASGVSLYHWTNNGWVLFANGNSCNGVRIEKYISDKEQHLKAFEDSCEAFLNLWTKITLS